MSGIIEFDVGGVLIKTSLETIMEYKESKLWKTICEKEQYSNDSISIEIFIDHNPKRFIKVLDCLRDREIP